MIFQEYFFVFDYIKNKKLFLKYHPGITHFQMLLSIYIYIMISIKKHV